MFGLFNQKPKEIDQHALYPGDHSLLERGDDISIAPSPHAGMVAEAEGIDPHRTNAI